MLIYLGLFGIIVTSYAIYIERQKKGHRAMCDVSENISCTRVLKSPYARMMGLIFNLKNDHVLNLPNTYFGILFYFAIIIYNFIYIPYQELLLVTASFLSLCASFGLAYILYYKLQDFCIVCVTTYFINVAIFYYAMDALLKKID